VRGGGFKKQKGDTFSRKREEDVPILSRNSLSGRQRSSRLKISATEEGEISATEEKKLQNRGSTGRGSLGVGTGGFLKWEER